MKELFAFLRNSYPGRRILVLGHDRPDTDTVMATEMLCRAASRCGIDAERVSTGTTDPHTTELLTKDGIDPTGWMPADRTRAEDLLFLVDCHDTPHEGIVIGCVDHHPAEQAPEYPYYRNERASSSTLMVFRLARSEGIAMTEADEVMAVRSVFADTESMLSPKFMEADRAWIAEAIGRLSLDRDTLVKDGLCFSDLTEAPEKVAAGGLKYHVFSGSAGTRHRCATSHIEAEDIPEELIGESVRILRKRREEEGLELWVLIVVEPLSQRSRVYEITGAGIEVRQYARFISRAVDILPELERRFLSRP